MRRRFINKSKIDFDYNDYMTIEALEDNVEISLVRSSEYGINGIGWTKYKNSIVVNSGDFVSIKDILNKGEVYGNIYINGKCNLRGNCNSLIFGDYASSHNDLSGYDYCFRGLLKNNSGVQEVDSNFLPATTLANYCYESMFSGCTSLTTAPELPATILAIRCYSYMFYSCTSLTTAPELPATTLDSNCYYYMFSYCIGLTTAPELPATTLAINCYNGMFSGCTSLTTAPELPATILDDSCYCWMFQGCTSLTTAPELPATTLDSNCYNSMFRGCTSLTTAPELPATTLANYCYESMFQGCTSLTTAPELPATTLDSNCYNSMFFGCTSLTTAPELPATILDDRCYYWMFRYCSKINYIKMLAIDISASDCLYGWVQGVSSTGTFVKNSDMTSLPTGSSGIPSGWTVVNDGDNVNLITFTVDGVEYQAEEGMTWKEWCNSEYNTAGFIYDWTEIMDGIYTSDYKKYFIWNLNDSSLVTTGVYLTKAVTWSI